jgi:AraC-like DNA-binding protein
MALKDIYATECWQQKARKAAYNLNALADLLHICPRQLQRYTRKLFNSSPQRWLNEQRLTDATDMLASDEMVKTVAFKLGFKTVSHFSHLFKSRYGISPAKFKQQKGL